MRRLLLSATVLLACCAAPAQALTGAGKVLVCDIDTGINAAHQEFAADQLVGFYDFSDGKEPAAGQMFDPDTPVSDPDGHGTATASMIGALGKSTEQTPSGYPGVKLAMAKVADADGAIAGDLGAAIRWCVGTVKADAINMSIGVVAPVGPAQALFQDTFDAMHEARAKGVLFTVSNGNGIGNTGVVPGDGATTPYGSSLDALSVGASGIDGLLVAYNPEVAALYSVRTPTPDGHDTYRDIAGTSFASPFTGGFGARLIAEALAARRTPPVADIEQTIKGVATDTDIPPLQEGYGVISLAELPAALAAVRAGTVPTPADATSGQYVETVAGGLRKVSNGMAPTAAYADPGATAPVAGGVLPAPAATATAVPSVGATPDPSATATATPSPTVTPVASPKLGAIRVLRKRPVRLRVLVDQRVTLTLVVRRSGRRITRRVLRYRGPGAVTLRLGKLRKGKYRARIRATSELGGGSAAARTKFRVR